MRFSCAAGHLCQCGRFKVSDTITCANCNNPLHDGGTCSQRRHEISGTEQFKNKGSINDQICYACIEKAVKASIADETAKLSPKEQYTKSTNQQKAILEVMTAFSDIRLIFEEGEKIAKELGITDELIVYHLEEFKRMTPKTMPATEIAPEDAMEKNEDEKNLSGQDKRKRVRIDFHKLVSAGREGKLFFFTWCKGETTWRVVPLPKLLVHPERDEYRCMYFEELAPHFLCTLIHNAIINIDNVATQALHETYFKGYHCSDGAYTLDFMGNDVKFFAKCLTEAIYGKEAMDKGNPGNWSDEDIRSVYRGNSTLPNETVRKNESYVHLHPHRLRAPDAMEVMGEDRYKKIVIEYCQKNNIPHGGEETMVDYLKSIEGLHVILAPLFFTAKEIASNVHLFRALDKLHQKMEHDNEEKEREREKSKESTNAEENIIAADGKGEEEKNEEEAATAKPTDSENAQKGRKKYRIYTDTYNNLKTKHTLEGFLNYEALAKDLKEHAQDKLLPMLQSTVEGLKEGKRDHIDYVYANSNFLRSWLGHLIKPDRSGNYEQSIDISLITAEIMKKVGVEAFGGLDTPGHEFILRMKFAVPTILHMLIQNGPLDEPMSGSKCVIYSDNYRQCPLEIHWMEICSDFLDKYDDSTMTSEDYETAVAELAGREVVEEDNII